MWPPVRAFAPVVRDSSLYFGARITIRDAGAARLRANCASHISPICASAPVERDCRCYGASRAQSLTDPRQSGMRSASAEIGSFMTKRSTRPLVDIAVIS